MPSGQMVSIEVWSNPNWIQQWDKPSSRWKRECVLRSEARHGQAGGLKFQLFFVFWFVCVFFAVSRSCLKQMKVLEERLMYLFIVFCKELLCVSIPFWLKDFHLCVYIFRFCLLSQQFSLDICSRHWHWSVAFFLSCRYFQSFMFFRFGFTDTGRSRAAWTERRSRCYH